MANIMDLYKAGILVSLFYSIAITILVYVMPAAMINNVEIFSEPANNMNLESIGQQVEGSLTSQTEIPVVELGALVFYSGNILVDLLLNFATAIPQMITILVSGLSILINIDTMLLGFIELFFSVIMMVLWVIGLIQLVTGMRSGRLI